MLRLTDYRVLTLDCYGTLIDWEIGIWDALQPLIMYNGRSDVTRETALRAFAQFENRHEGFWCRQPTGIGDNEIWRIVKRNGILYLPDVGSKTTSFFSAFAGIFASN